MDQLDFLKPSKRQRLKRRDKRLSEELIECRRGKGGKRNKKLREKGDKKRTGHDLSSETPRHRSSYGDKRNRTYQNDNLEPLARFLQTHVGQDWDLVYSKLNKQLDKRSMLGLHVFEHLFDFVDVHAKLIDGKIVLTNRYGSPQPSHYFFPKEFYVHPKSNLLLVVSAKKQKGPYPKKARWKKAKEKQKLKNRLGINSTPIPKYRFTHILTHGKRLTLNSVYDIRISDQDHGSRCRVKLVKIFQAKGEIKLHVQVLKSALKQKVGEIVLSSDILEKYYRYRSYNHTHFCKWKIYDTGTFGFSTNIKDFDTKVKNLIYS